MNQKNFAIKAKKSLVALVQEGKLRTQSETNQVLQLAKGDPWASCFDIALRPQL